MSKTTERDARLRLYAEVGEARQYIGPQEDEYGASALLRADVASMLKERDALAAAQARIAELEAALRRITQAHQDAAYDHEAQRAAVFNFVGNVAENALSASSPKDALRSVCEKVAREMDRVTSKDIEDDWPGTTDQRIDEVVSSIIGEVKP